MLTELGDDPSDEGSIQLVSVANDSGLSFQENEEINESFVFGNALSSAQNLRQVEDIRAIFQILGIGSYLHSQEKINLSNTLPICFALFTPFFSMTAVKPLFG